MEFLRPEDRDNISLRNVGIFPYHYMVS